MSSLALLLFTISSIFIFWIDQLWLICGLFVVELGALAIFHLYDRRLLRFAKSVLPFITLTVISNYFFSDLQFAMLIASRLTIMCLMTYLISHKFTSTQISQSIAKLFTPLKLFNINTTSITIIIAVAISFIPILTNEARQITLALRAKGFNFSIINLLTYPKVFIATYFRNLFARMASLELALLIKGYG